MPARAKSMCRKAGCPNLVDKPGYCPQHTPDSRAPFRRLDERKTEEHRLFYSGRRWTETSRQHRMMEPLCRRCKAAGKVVAADMVHHNPPREELIARGINPYDHDYLESLCNWHHLEELRAKRR